MSRLFLFTLLCLCLLPFAATTGDDSSKKTADIGKAKVESSKSARSKKASARSAIKVTKQQEVAALALVKEHHNDLLELLINLKENVPNEYARAIRDLSRASDRLTAFEARDIQRYELELKLWQAQSERQLVTAKLQMGYDEKLVKELRGVLREEFELGISIMKYERQRLAGRVAKLDEQIKTQEDGLDAAIKKRLDVLTRSSKNSQRDKSNKSRKAPTRNKKKDPA